MDAGVRGCLKYLKPRGLLTVIHRADRLDHVLQALRGRVGDLRLLPLTSKEGQNAKRILLSGRKGVANPCVLFPPLYVHQRDGSYTAEAAKILRDGQALEVFARAPST